jgi:DNA-nicking Smr family endonuclease
VVARPRNPANGPDGRRPDESERELFERAVGPVRPVRGRKDVARRPGRTRRQTGEAAARHEDATEASPGAEQLLLRPLRRGQLEIDAELDLHRLDTRAAAERLASWLTEMRGRGHRVLLVICGRGHHSADRPRLRPWLLQWLRRHADGAGVLAWSPAQTRHGGEGAVYLRLRRSRRTADPA